MALSEKFSCYGVDSYNLYSKNLIRDLNKLAEYYLVHIESVMKDTGQSNYLFLGWSLGGQIALEISSILESKGYNDTKVYLLDTKLKYYSDNSHALYQTEKDNYLSKLASQGFDISYIHKVAKLLDVENNIQHQKITSELAFTKIALLKAMQIEVQPIPADNLSSYIEVSNHNIERAVKNASNLKIINVYDASHTTILKKESLILSELTA
ncbi:MAG: hypothetical protein BGO67_10250 [Alphaproteobacteria bacterium 41-28]|nr:MAG: hypothetical protein BGO67_10250 [Alphaproteobacteria bacterium 41-28]